jgi:hypothetical protein
MLPTAVPTKLFPLYPVSPASPLLMAPHQERAGTLLRDGDSRGSRRRPLLLPSPPPTSLVALKQLYGGRIEAVSLLAGLFLHFSSSALTFSTLASLPLPPPSAGFFSLPLICQPSQDRGPLASKVIELSREGRDGLGFCASALGFRPLLRAGGGWLWQQTWTVELPYSPAALHPASPAQTSASPPLGWVGPHPEPEGRRGVRTADR